MPDEEGITDSRKDDETMVGMTGLDPDVIRFILDSNPELTIMENELSGKNFDEIKGAWVKSSFLTPRLNDRGIKHLMSDMRIRICKLTTQSRIDEKLINTIIKRYSFNTALWLFQYEEDWGIKNPADRTMILRMLVDTYLLTLYRAKDGWSGNSLSKIYKKSEIFQERPKEKKGLRRFLPF